VVAARGSDVLKLSAEIYPLGAIRRAMEAFSPCARLSVETRGPYHEVVIVPVSESAERLAGEFANYVLAVVAHGVDVADAAPVRTT
jgi:hypothetical protein